MTIDESSGMAAPASETTAEQLRTQLRRICERHADLTGMRFSDGNPAMPGMGLQMHVATSPDGSLFLAINDPVFGWVNNTLNAASCEDLRARLDEHAMQCAPAAPRTASLH